MRDSNGDISRQASFVSSVKLDSESGSKMSMQQLVSSCRICLSSLWRPAALTCGHRFCERCLDQYWRVGERPTCIVCPLCRACAVNVHFAKEDKITSCNEFRRTFSPVVRELEIRRAAVFCAKVSALTPALYFLIKWLKPPVLHLFKIIYLMFASKV